MYDDSLQQLVLSGALFNGGGNQSPPRNRSSSASRSPSPFAAAAPADSPSSDSGYVGSSAHHPNRPESPPQESIGLGPGRTGVKGVIRDRDEAREIERGKAQVQRNAVAQRQKKLDFSVNDYFTELDLSGRKDTDAREGDAWEGVEAWRKKRMDELKASSGTRAGAIYGQLREIGVGGYVEAVEKVPRDIWVVLHIYDASLNRCAILDSHLSSLARRYPTVKFLRARAGAIGFAVSSTSSISHPRTSTKRNTRGYRDLDKSDSNSDDDKDRDDQEWEPEPDYDVLPTMLVYRGGELVFSWPRVDFEVAGATGKGGGVGMAGAMDMQDVEALLAKYHIIQPSSSAGRRGARNGHDEEDDLELEFASDVE